MSPEAAVKKIMEQGGDPKAYRKGLAEHCGVDVSEIDAAIEAALAAGDKPSTDDPETIAQRRLADERRLRGTRAHREWDGTYRE